MSHAAKPTLFVTRDLSEHDAMRRYFEQRGYEVSGISPLQFRALTPATLPECDWVFAYSANAIRLLPQVLVDQLWSNETPIAVMGAGTAAACEKRGLRVDFCGNGEPSQVATAFAKTAGSVGGNRPTVTFLQAQVGTRSVERSLADRIVAQSVAVYATSPKPDWSLPVCDAAYFTSPSAVHAAVASTSLQHAKRYFCIGATTGSALAAAGVSVFEMVTPEVLHAAAC